MGKSISKLSKNNPIRFEDYNQINLPDDDSYSNIVNRRILKNRFTNLELEQYTLQFINELEMNKYYDVFYWRMTQENIVKTLHFYITKQQQCCSPICRAKIYTQRIMVRLSDIKEIPYPDNLYVLLASANAFQKIVQKIGFFDLQQNMIGINAQGQIKVWINEDLSSHCLDIESYQCHTEKDMAQRLINMVNENTDLQSEPASLVKYINLRCSNLNFYDLMLLVKQYARFHKTNIPSNFVCALQAIKQASIQTSRSFRSQKSATHFLSNDQRSYAPVQAMKTEFSNNNIKYVPSETRLLAQKADTPTFRKNPPYLSNFKILHQPKPLGQIFQRKQIVRNPNTQTITNQVCDQERVIHKTHKEIQQQPFSKFSPYSTSPISVFNSPKKSKTQAITETTTKRFATQKTSNTNNWIPTDSKNSLNIIKSERRDIEDSFQKTPIYYKNVSNRKLQNVVTQPFHHPQQTRQYFNIYSQSNLSNSPSIQRVPSFKFYHNDHQEKSYSQFQETGKLKVKGFKRRTLNQRDGGFTPHQVSIQRQESSHEKTSLHPSRKLLKDKYQMDPKLARDLARFYQNH